MRRCPLGHDSDDADYCSVCGAAINSMLAPRGPSDCPSCGAPRVAGARYCEVCRFDFKTGTPGPPPIVAPAGAMWEVTVAVDSALDVEPDPTSPPPADVDQRAIEITRAETSIGRRDDRQDIEPDIDIADPAVSRRHAKLLLSPDGQLAIVDLASANGTAVGGTELVGDMHRVLDDGDTITLGRWTRMTVRRRQGSTP